MRTHRDICELLAAVERDGGRLFAPRAALATITRTFGATFRRPGSRMLIGGDGRRVRGLSGGCPEADIAARAMQVIASGCAEQVRYDREYGLDALLELGCGGELEVLIEPVDDRAGLAFLELAARCWRERREGWLATLFAQDERCLPRPRRALWQDGWRVEEIGDPAVLQRLSALAEEKLRECLCTAVTLDAGDGRLELLLEALRPPVQLLIVGVNPVALALAELAARLGWNSTLVYHAAQAPGLPAATPALHAPPETLGRRAAIDARTYATVMTHNLERDTAYADALLATAAPYIGVLGSRRRSEELQSRLRAVGHALDGRLFAPAGLDIGSEDPDEIALSLLAQMKAFAGGKSGAPLHVLDTPIH
ncbi:MAG: XdhC family protein [Gammaproteobacteria bacterium]|nr:XdhC family protein [Gammaproteobacteria bacterium]